MRRAVLFACAAVAATLFGIFSAAHAADMRLPPPQRAAPYVAPVYAPVYTFTGWHVGATVGYAAGSMKEPGIDLGIRGFSAGVEAGYRHQFANRFILGLAVDADKTWLDGSMRLNCGPLITCSALGGLSWKASVRGEVGYAITDRLALLANAGLVYARGWGEARASFGPFSTVVRQTGSDWGHTFGAGAAYLWTPNIYTDVRYQYVGGLAFGPAPQTRVSAHEVKVGLHYKF